ncbi:TPR-like protein [Setomelanomma holmii]|uniref:TPR-like protein n=1 Tax=Setomelanomma holmii TaxID=210430 RepID=A0A9P4LGH8_9PLEO|nr:TPR-like protein [Setomelanomma holmii]
MALRQIQSFREIAEYVKMPRRLDPKANIFELVHDWLRGSKERWLLVLDNVDDAGFLIDSPAHGQGQPADDSRTASRPLRAYLPCCERGSILITTRNKAAALTLVESCNIISVDPMNKAQALALFKKKMGEALEYMPLAIVQAAAYISHRAPRCSVARYLEEFKKSECKRSSLLNHDGSQLRRDWEANNSIIVTWRISFEYIQQTRSSAADLLSLMSFFDRQGIPENLLRPRTEWQEVQTRQTETVEDDGDSDSEDDISQSSVGGDEFEDDIVALRNFCFISVDTSSNVFEMHALVQLATRMWLEANSKLERWQQQFIRQRPDDELLLAEWATLLYRAAWFAETAGNITDAEMLAIKAMKARKKILGQEHEDTIWSIAMVADAYSLGGQWDKAEKLRKQVMETRKKKLGADHPDTLTSMANLASTYRNQGRWDAAEELFVQVMETSKKKLGADHPDTLTSMANLASTYRNQGRWDAAEELEVQVIETSKKKLGADHPDTLTSMANLGVTYSMQGKQDKAEPLKVQVIETSKKKLGADHPSTLTSMANLAFT